ncbi:DNA cytosine methyltransferase [Rhizobium leguminosarum]|uniref:DNA cytosine methyltransferase n=1 Tax=Rhizobium leguminosarum TaxID=384 RepID=UPI0035122CC6
MNVLDLFSGIGGFSLGLERAGFETVAFCEINPFCRAVLKKHWPSVPCFGDVRTLNREALASIGIRSIDVICGGYPCQPFSSAGNRRGKADDRHLWPEMFRLIRELRPTWVIGENVAGHITMGLDDVLSDLEAQGYSARTFVVPACAVNAPHRRDRVWIVAHSNGQREQQPEGRVGEERRWTGDGGENVANAQGDPPWRLPERTSTPKSGPSLNGENPASAKWPRAFSHWASEPRVGRMAHGIPNRMDRIKSLGNGLVSDIPEAVGTAIKAIEEGITA